MTTSTDISKNGALTSSRVNFSGYAEYVTIHVHFVDSLNVLLGAV